jgi:hypothetical protein
MAISPKRPDEEKLLAMAVDFANKYIPLLGIPKEHNESALKAYVAGFFAGKGAQQGEAMADRESN